MFSVIFSRFGTGGILENLTHKFVLETLKKFKKTLKNTHIFSLWEFFHCEKITKLKNDVLHKNYLL